MKNFLILLFASLLMASVSAQTATITPNPATYAAGGGQITFTVALTFPTGASSASFSIKPPTNTWVYLSTAGTAVPQVLPNSNDTTTPADPQSVFGWAYSDLTVLGSGAASYTFTLSYPAGLAGAQSFALAADYRVGGVLTPITIPALVIQPTPVAPAITTQPANVSVASGANATFAVAASGIPTPTLKWQRSTDGGTSFADLANDSTFGGVATATLSITGTTNSMNGHKFRAVATNGNPPDAISNVATLTVTFAPAVASGPRTQAISTGSSLVLSVVATGSPAPTYQWKKGATVLLDGGRVSGSTTSTLTIANAQAGDEGAYSVVVSNGINPDATSSVANITLVAAGFIATHSVVGAGYVPSTATSTGTVTITNTFNYSGELSGLRWAVLLPTGWSFDSATNAGTPASQPEAGLTGLVEWLWSVVPASGSSFTYSLRAPVGALASFNIAALAEYGVGGDQIQILAKPDPLIVNPVLYHSADTDTSKWFISGSELLRVITLYNTKFTATDGTKQRTGAYRVRTVLPASADGFEGDTSRVLNAPAALAKYHSADYGTSGVSGTSPPDGQIDGSELLRLITLYNTKYTFPDGTKQRTGAYKVQAGTRDGYGPDPTMPPPTP